MEDFPAAHSMDTEWFALDEHGRVGRFESGEDGAVPLDAAIGLGPSDGSVDDAVIHAVRIAHMLANRAATPDAEPLLGDAKAPRPTAGRTLLVLDPLESYRGSPDLSVVDPAPEGSEFVRVGSRLPVVLLSRGELSQDRVEELAARPTVRLLVNTSDLYELLDELREAGADDGFFHFAHDFDNDPGFYGRGSSPQAPLSLDDFPEADRAQIGALRLAVDFAEQDVHLADLLEAEQVATWGDVPLRRPETDDAAPAPPQTAPRRKPSLVVPAIVAVAVAIAYAILTRR